MLVSSVVNFKGDKSKHKRRKLEIVRETSSANQTEVTSQLYYKKVMTSNLACTDGTSVDTSFTIPLRQQTTNIGVTFVNN